MGAARLVGGKDFFFCVLFFDFFSSSSFRFRFRSCNVVFSLFSYFLQFVTVIGGEEEDDEEERE